MRLPHFLLPVMIYMSLGHFGATFYRNLGVIELVRVVRDNEMIFVIDVAPISDSNLTLVNTYLYQSLAWNSESAPTARLIALVSSMQGDWSRAVQMAEYATQRNPLNPMGNVLLGYIYWRTGRLAEGIQVWRQAKAAVFLFNRAALYRRAVKSDQALEFYDLARQVDPRVSPRIEDRVDVAWALYFAGRKSEAFAELRAGLDSPYKEDWQKLIARGEMGMYYLREGQWQDAIEYYQEALTLGPGVVQYRLWLGRSYMELSELDLAEKELWRTVSDASVGDLRASAYLFLGQLYARRGQSDQSVDAYAQAVRLSPDNLEFRLYLARAYSNAGQKELALEEWKAIVSMFPDDPQLRVWYEEAKLK